MVRDGQDLDITLRNIAIDGEPIDLTDVRFTVKLWTRDYGNMVVIEHDEYDNVCKGKIPANIVIEGNEVHIYAQASKAPLGPGSLMCSMEFVFDNENFPEGEQVVKTLDIDSHVQIIG